MNIEKNWDMMAKAYEDFTEGEDSYSYKIEWPCIKKMLPDLNGKNVLDIGCGTGRFTFLLEKENAKSITGLDLSTEMLNLAKEKADKQSSKAEFIKGDMFNLENSLHRKYDFIFSSTSSHFINDLKSLFRQISSVLNIGGQAVISVINPVYSAQYPIKHGDEFPSDDEWIVKYLDKSERSYIQPWIEYNDDIENYLCMSYHHTFSDYINAAIAAGLSIEEVEEPYPPEEWKESEKGRYDNFIETPTYLIMKLKKN